ncbi:MAG: heavy-metal-associated domain-containing protein [Burkholderiaceae bacterium]
MKTVTLDVQGMTCGGCVASVTRMLTGIDGVQSAQVSLDKSEATVVFDEQKTAPASLVAAVEDGGFDAALKGA